MQKKFIALAIAALASGAAFAQSNVTVYGTADLTFDSVDASGASGGSTANRSNFTRVSSNSSILGFKGEETLGNGLKAVFQFEAGPSIENNQTSVAFTRDTFVGLTGAFGTIKGGAYGSMSRVMSSAIDMNTAAAGPGANNAILGKVVGGAGTGYFDTRNSNTVTYISPSVLGGLAANVSYVAAENRSLDNAAVNDKKNGNAFDAGLMYNNGPLLVGLNHGRLNTGIDGNVTAIAQKKVTLTRLAGTYTFPAGHRVTAVYEQNKADYALLGSTKDVKRDAFGLGGKLMVVPNGGLIVQYYQAKDATGSYYASNNATGARMYEIGYEHNLSKRTILKASYNRIDNKDNANYDFGNNAVGGSFGVGANPSVVSAGIRHSF